LREKDFKRPFSVKSYVINFVLQWPAMADILNFLDPLQNENFVLDHVIISYLQLGKKSSLQYLRRS
jgi:hypothetical protein